MVHAMRLQNGCLLCVERGEAYGQKFRNVRFILKTAKFAKTTLKTDLHKRLGGYRFDAELGTGNGDE